MNNTTWAAVGVALASAISTLCAASGPEIALWPDAAPGSEGKDAKEIVTTNANGEISVRSIHRPSLTPYLPQKPNSSRAAMLVVPGGGHRVLAITHEGYNVAEWLSERGIASFVLKHRLARETNSTYRIELEAFADAERAMRVIRSRAREWNIDPSRVGAIGFSAGGELVNMLCARGKKGEVREGIDAENARPDFQALIYPGRSADIQPTQSYPPVFLACSYTDRKDIAEGLAEVYLRFKRAGVPAELHIYSSGGHGFGLRSSNVRPVGNWSTRLVEWMADSELIALPK
jgi:acetyl esterase/lipase